MGSAVLIESGLSFLGIGIPVEEVSWGKLLNEARKNFSAWWLAIFPGAAIFLLISSFHALGDSLQRYFQPRMREGQT
jgi:peptide/nickel transport system permease protein